ncbi:MAG: tripartite tricarboxylate transporter substrate binding protein [Betaproteobacteria bacterium]|nr:tripartite tricarboxylate transporter substrate binding protein [Betaproteobacteria bacterium]
MIARFATVACCGLLNTFAPVTTQAQSYPNKPIRMIIGYPPGGGTDIVARLVAQQLADSLGQQVVVDNRSGANTMLAAGLAAKAAADGYTLLFASASLTINPSLYSKVPYDAARDFAPVTLVASTPFVLVVQSSFSARSVRELVTLAKSKPGELMYSSGGSGSTGHLAAELFKSTAGVEIQHIPYKGLAAAITDLLGGRVSLTFASLPSVAPLIKAGRLKALALTTTERLATLPDLPTMAESGFSGYDVNQWFGVLVPAGTPRAIIVKLNTEIRQFLNKPEVKERFSLVGAEPVSNSPEQFGAYIKADLSKWAKVVSMTGARVD